MDMVFCIIASLCLHKYTDDMVVFSAPEPKAQVHYCDYALSVVRPSVCPSVRR